MGKEHVVEIPLGSGNQYRYSYDQGSTNYLGPVGSAPDLGEEEFMMLMGEGKGRATLLAHEYQEYPWTDPIIVYVDKENMHPDPSKRLIWGYDADGNLVKGDYKEKFNRLKEIPPIKINYKIEGLTTAHQEKQIHVDAIKKYFMDEWISR